MPLLWKQKTPTLLEEKKNHIQDFSFSKNLISEVFFGFYNQGKPYFECITDKVFRWNLAFKWCKKKKKIAIFFTQWWFMFVKIFQT